MSKKRFSPLIHLTDPWIDPPDPTIPVHNTGAGTESAPGAEVSESLAGPLSFADWSGSYGVDLDENGEIDFNDYLLWWTNKGYDMDAWNMVNPGVAFGVAAAETDVIPGE